MNPTWTVAELAYFAGILDGEGCLSLGQVRRNNNGTPSRAAHVSVVNTDTRLIYWLLNRFGGTVHPHKKHRAHHKQTWVWTLCGSAIDVLLEAVLPYLMLKREQALLILEFRKTIVPNVGGSARPRLTPEIVQYRDELSERISALNRKGIAS